MKLKKKSIIQSFESSRAVMLSLLLIWLVLYRIVVFRNLFQIVRVIKLVI